MASVKRQYSKGRIDRAGKELVELPKDDPRRDEAIAVVDNWRSCHAYPLQIIKMTLLNRAKKIDKDALIAQRLKRRPSIEIKLHDNPNMKLSQMQDLGGCRAIVHEVSHVKNLVAEYRKADAKSPKDRSRWDGLEDSDYISRPKPDGYRSVHLIFRFQSRSAELQCFNGQRIEVQIRTQLQHLWATAVETAQVFTGQALKSRIKNASEDWLRFFALMSALFAIREKSPIVPGTSEDREELKAELRGIIGHVNIMDSLRGWNTAIHFFEEGKAVADDESPAMMGTKRTPLTNEQKQAATLRRDATLLRKYGAVQGAEKLEAEANRVVPAKVAEADSFVLELDPSISNLKITPFRRDEIGKAQELYEKAEKEAENDPSIQVVLVAVENVDALRKAYPNYYVDTEAFLLAVKQEMEN